MRRRLEESGKVWQGREMLEWRGMSVEVGGGV